MELVNFAIDFGNGYVKAKSGNTSFIYPSLLGYYEDIGESSLGSGFESEHDVHVYQRKDEEKYVCGPDLQKAIDPSKLISTNSANNRYALHSFKRLVDFALAELGSYENQESIDVRLVTGMPSDEIHMEEKKETFENYLKGRHVVTRNGVEYVINVKECRIIEQPLGTLLNEFLDDNLKIHKTFKNGVVTVIDFGSGTTIIDIYKNMKRIGGDTKNEGMILFYKQIAQELTKKHSKKVSSAIVEKGVLNGSFTAEFGLNAIPFKSEFKRIITKKIESVIQDYEAIIGEESIVDMFLLTGGGTNIMGENIMELMHNFHAVENAQTATVNGYFKLAKSIEQSEKVSN